MLVVHTDAVKVIVVHTVVGVPKDTSTGLSW